MGKFGLRLPSETRQPNVHGVRLGGREGNGFAHLSPSCILSLPDGVDRTSTI